MIYSNLPRASFGALPSQKNRAIRLKWGERKQELEDWLLPQRSDVRESLFGGIGGSVACVSTRAGIPLNMFVGLPESIQLVTDEGGLLPINGIAVDAREGECGGSLATYQLFVRDALTILERRINTRIFRQKNVLDVIHTGSRGNRTRTAICRPSAATASSRSSSISLKNHVNKTRFKL